MTITLPEMLKKEIESIPRTGYYDNKSEFIRDAVRTLFVSRKELRIGTAVEMYTTGDITLSKAAEIADVGFEDMKEILADRGIPIRRGEPPSEAKAKEIIRLRR